MQSPIAYCWKVEIRMQLYIHIMVEENKTEGYQNARHIQNALFMSTERISQ